MIERAVKCPKCSATMEPGFVLDKTYSTVAQSSWVEGAPEPSIWTGLRLKNHECLKISTYRCTGCGYLESYAPSQG